MVDFYVKKQRLMRQLAKYLLDLQQRPETWNPKTFEFFIRSLATETGFSESTIHKELAEMGLVYDKQERVLRRSVTSYEKVRS